MSANGDKGNTALENDFPESSECNLDAQDIYIVFKVSPHYLLQDFLKNT